MPSVESVNRRERPAGALTPQQLCRADGYETYAEQRPGK